MATPLLGRSVELLGQHIKGLAGVAVTYSRGDDEVELTAVPGFTDFTVEGPDGVVETFQTRDWIVEAEDLVLDSSTVLPVKGDEITEGTKTYRVLYLEGVGTYRFSDQYRTILRIHTKQV